MFSPDSKIMQVFSRLADLVLLNILFLITCLPVFTIGAAVTALYTMCFRLMREEYSGIIRSYFKAFRDNFKTATAAWLLVMLAAAPAIYYLSQTLLAEGFLRSLWYRLLAWCPLSPLLWATYRHCRPRLRSALYAPG